MTAPTRRSIPVIIRVCCSVVLLACELGERTLEHEPIDAIEPGVERELTRTSPCNLMVVDVVAASNPAANVALFVRLRLDPPGASVGDVYAVAAADADVWMTRGTNLFSDACNQVAEWGMWVIEERWEAMQDATQEGTIEVVIDPGAPRATLEFATVTLVDVRLRRVDEDAESDIVIDELVMPRP